MQVNPTISIIIPVFNRAVLLPDTLNSIIDQTMVDWECILVDDHSTDNSIEIMNQYKSMDTRFKVYSRPFSKKKGANSCRNYGFLKSNGKYIKWFDSDDIMLPTHLEVAYKELNENGVDFVISDTVNFDTLTGNFTDKPYNFDYEAAIISADSYALHSVCWITDDFLAKKEILVGIDFNEDIVTDGDEYNFFTKLLHTDIKGKLINEVLTHRRVHTGSLSRESTENTFEFYSKTANVKFQTAGDLVKFDNEKLIRWFLSGYMQYAFKLALANKKIPHSNKAFILIRKYYSFGKAVAFITSILIGKYIGKGYVVMKYARS